MNEAEFGHFIKMDKVMERFTNLLPREEKLFGVKSNSLQENVRNEKIHLGLVYLYCEYSIIRNSVIELYSDFRLTDNEILLARDTYQIVSARIIELLPIVNNFKQPTWLKVFSKIQCTQVRKIIELLTRRSGFATK